MGKCWAITQGHHGPGGSDRDDDVGVERQRQKRATERADHEQRGKPGAPDQRLEHVAGQPERDGVQRDVLEAAVQQRRSKHAVPLAGTDDELAHQPAEREQRCERWLLQPIGAADAEGDFRREDRRQCGNDRRGQPGKGAWRERDRLGGSDNLARHIEEVLNELAHAARAKARRVPDRRSFRIDRPGRDDQLGEEGRELDLAKPRRLIGRRAADLHELDRDRHFGHADATRQRAASLRHGADALRRQGEYLVWMRLAIDHRDDDRRIAVAEAENVIALRSDFGRVCGRTRHEALLGHQLLGEIQAKCIAWT